MSTRSAIVGKAVVIALVAIAATGCAAQRSAKSDTAIFLDGDRLHTGTGATISNSSGGSVSGGAPSAEPKEPRGNTPPGVARDGSKPADGAIVDPSGAATKN